MSLGLILPALIVVVVASLAGVVRWPLRPAIAIRVLSVIAGVGSATVLVMALVVVVGFFARSAVVFSLVAWCPLVPLHHEVSVIDGLAAMAVLAAWAWRVRRVLSLRRWASDGTEGRSMVILDTCEPIAFAAPRPSH